MIDALELRAGMRILELGAGSGRLAIQIKRRHPGVAIDAVDVDARMVAHARRNAAGAGVEIEFREACMTSLPARGAIRRVLDDGVPPPLAGGQGAGARRGEPRARSGRPLRRRRFRPAARPAAVGLFSWIQQPLDGCRNTRPHRDGRFERALRDAFDQVRPAAVWRTAAGTIEAFVCTPTP